MSDLAKRIVLITGAGSGIGRAAMDAFRRTGARVAALDRTQEDLGALPEDVLPLAADVALPEAVQHAVDAAADHFGRLDVVCANAGINGVWAAIEELEPAEFMKTLEVNLAGTFYTIKYAVPHLKRHGGAVIITSSVNGTRMFSNTGATAYAASKGGQVVLGRMLALELAKYGIRVNTVCPGAIDTNIRESTEKRDLDHIRLPVHFPEGRIPLTRKYGTPDMVADAMVFLASDAARFISGTEIWVDGAQSLLEG